MQSDVQQMARCTVARQMIDESTSKINIKKGKLRSSAKIKMLRNFWGIVRLQKIRTIVCRFPRRPFDFVIFTLWF